MENKIFNKKLNKENKRILQLKAPPLETGAGLGSEDLKWPHEANHIVSHILEEPVGKVIA